MDIDLHLILAILAVVSILATWLFFSVWRRFRKGELFDQEQDRLIDTFKLLKQEIERPAPEIQYRRFEEWSKKDTLAACQAFHRLLFVLLLEQRCRFTKRRVRRSGGLGVAGRTAATKPQRGARHC